MAPNNPYGLTPSDLDPFYGGQRPTFAPAAPAPKRGLLSSALATGAHELAGLTGSAAEAFGQRVGAPSVQDWGRGVAQSQFQQAAQSGRPDLEVAPWEEGGGGWRGAPSWAAYQAVKQVPQMGAMLAAGALVPEAVVPAALGRVGAALPAVLGGGRGLAAEAAAAAGKDWARQAVGATIAGYPMAVGSMYEEAKAAGGGQASGEEAGRALAMGPAYAALDAMGPAQASGLLKRGPGEGLLKGAAKSAAFGALSEIPQEAAQTAMEQSFRPDLSTPEKARNIVNAAITGGVVGGVFGGSTSAIGSVIRPVQNVSPDQVSTEALDAQTAQVLEPEKAPTPAEPPPEVAEAPPVASEPVQPVPEAAGGGGLETEPYLPGLEPEPEPVAQPTPEAPSAPVEPAAPAAPSTKQLFAEALGGKVNKKTNPFTTALADDAPLVETLATVRTQLAEAKRPTNELLTLGKSFGIINSDGSPKTPRRIDSDITRLEKKVAGYIEKSQKGEKLSKAQEASLSSASTMLERLRSTKEAIGLSNEQILQNQQTRVAELTQPKGQAATTEYQGSLPLEGFPDAIQEPRTAEMDVREQAANGGALAEGNLAGQVAPEGGFAPFAQEGPSRTSQRLAGIAPELTEGEITSDVRNEAAASQNATLIQRADAQNQRIRDKRTELEASRAARGGVRAVNRPQMKVGETAAPMASEAFDQSFTDATSKLPDNLRARIEVVNSAKDLPEPIRAEAAKRKMDVNGVSGTLYNGKIYMVRDAHTSPEEIQRTLAHEIMHGGANVLHGENRDFVMGQLFDRAGGLTGALDVARQLGANINLSAYIPNEDVRGLATGNPKDDVKAMLMDELFAHAAEQIPQERLTAEAAKGQKALYRWLDKVRAGVAAFFNSIGFRDLAKSMNRLTPREFAQQMVQMRGAAESGASMKNRVADDIQPKIKTVKDFNDQSQNTVSGILAGMKKAIGDGKSLTAKGRIAELYLSDTTHIAERWGKAIPKLREVLRKYNQVWDDRHARLGRMADLSTTVQEIVQKADHKDWLNELITGVSAERINPELDYEKQTWLHELPLQDELKARHQYLQQLMNKSKQKEALTYKAYAAIKDYHEFERTGLNAELLHHILKKDTAYASVYGANESPVSKMVHESATHKDVASAKDYMKGELDRMLKSIEQFLEKQRNLGLSGDALLKATKLTSELSSVSSKIRGEIVKQEKVPYFHAARDGSYAVSFQLARVGEGKKASLDLGKLKTVRERLAPFGDYVLSDLTDQDKAFIRVKSDVAAENLFKELRKLKEEGFLGDKPPERFNRDPYTIEFTKEQQLNSMLAAVSSAFAPDSSLLDEDEVRSLQQRQNEAQEAVRQGFLSATPENAIVRINQRRKYVAGAQADAIQAQFQRMPIGAQALANISSASEIRDVHSEMEKIIAQNRGEPDFDVFAAQDVYRELRQREASRVARPQSDLLRTASDWMSTYFLGFSPSFSMLQLLQMPQLGWPQLAKNYGFVRAAKAMGEVTADAYRVMGQVYKDRGFSDPIVSAKAIEAAFPNNKAMQETLIGLVNRGKVDLSAASREMTRAAEGAVLTGPEKFKRMGLASGYYTEAFTRVLMGLAAAKLYDSDKQSETKLGLKRDQYIDSVIDNSLWNYSPESMARFMTNGGVFGPAGPLLFKFMNYQVHLMGKIGRELHDAFGGDENARRWLGAHTTAMVITAGALGLPFVTLFAGMYDELKDLIDGDDEPSDIKSHLRTLASEMLGNDVAEAVMHGGFRPLGADITQRAGEQDLFPGSRLLADRRNLSEKMKDLSSLMAGAPLGFVANMAKGAEKLAAGDFVKGMQQFVPVGAQGVFKAGYMVADGGIRDTKGNLLPVKPSTMDIVTQAIGFTPSRVAEYREQATADRNREAVLRREGSNITQKLATAIETGDQDAVAQWMSEMQQFDASHPERALGQRFGSVMASRAKKSAMAEATHTPLGTKPNSGAQERYPWANW